MSKRRLLGFAGIGLFIFIAISFLAVPYFVHRYIENNSEKWTGRKITLHDLGFNIFTGGVSVDTLIVREQDKQGIFFKADRIYVNLELIKIIFGNYEIVEITVANPQVNILQNGDHFNFDDLVTRFAAVDSTTQLTEPTEPTHYRLEKSSILNGTFRYANLDLGSEIKLIRLNTECPLVAWDDPSMKILYDFLFDKGGKMKGDFDLNNTSMDYRARYSLDSLNIGIFFPYVKDYMNAGDLTGHASNHQRIYGNFNKPESFAAAGDLIVNQFVLSDPKNDGLVATEEFKVVIDSINVEKELYDFKYISLTKPYMKFELFDEGNNFTNLMKGSDSSTGPSSDSLSTAVAYGNIFALIATSIQQLSENYAISNYKADSLVLRKGVLVFNDYTLHSKFNYLLEDLVVKAESINSANKELRFIAASTLNHSGKLDGFISVDPNGFKNMDIQYTIKQLKVSDFNPYSNYYVAHPFTDGICTYTSKSVIKNNYLNSNHKLFIKTIKVGPKEKNNTAYHIPIRLAVALLRDKNGDVNLELPIEGNLNDPKYKVGKVIWQVFKNLIGKAVASPGKLLASKSGVDEKWLTGFSWTPLQSELSDEQKKSLDAIVKSLETTPEMKVELVNVFNDQREMDALALRAGKKKFLFFHGKVTSDDPALSEEDNLTNQVHDQDSAFNAYLNQQLQTSDNLVSVTDKSKKLIGQEKLESKLQWFYSQRNKSIKAYLEEAKQLKPDRFHIALPKEKTAAPYESLSRTETNFFVEDN